MILDRFDRLGVDAPPSSSWVALGYDPAMEVTFVPIALAGDGDTATASSPAAVDACGCYWLPDAFAGDVDVWVKVAEVGSPPSSNEGLGLVACYGGSGVGYRLTWWWNSPGTTDACLTLIRNGAWDPNPYPPLQLVDGDELALRVVASETPVRLEALHRSPGGDWQTVGSWLDPLGLPAGDRVGLVIGETLKVDHVGAGSLDGAPAYIGAVRIDGVPADLERVLASVSIRHGRDDVDGPIQASTATLRLRRLSRTELKAWEVGGVLEVEDVDGELLFTGRLSDAELVVEDPRADPVLSVIAASTLAAAGRRSVGGHAWPAEPWGARMARILDEAGLVGVVQAPSPDVPLAATKPDEATGNFASTDALTALEETRDFVGATIYEQGDGSLVVQAFGSRGDRPPLTLDPAVVLYAPTWSQTLDVVNRVVLGYGYGDGTVTVDDAASQERYGVRWTGLFDSGLADAATARARAQLWVDRLSSPYWKLPGLTLLEPARLEVGLVLELGELPPSAPVSAWTPIVEGWTDVIEGPDWTQELVLSDPMLSGLALPWQDLPPDLLWQTVEPAARWTDAFTLGNLVGGARDA